MSHSGIKTLIYDRDLFLGEAEVFPTNGDNAFSFPNNEIRISHLSSPSDRCHPLSILHIISPFSLRCKIQVKSAAADQKSPIHALYLSCFQELKTAVVVSGNKEFHLVAMPTRVEKFPCLWCYSVPTGIYNSCLSLLNMRCLAIVFDLDETLIVANTMKSFEDRIEALSHRIDAEDDPIRISGMSAELKRYLEDKELLKQYIENDSVLDSGKLVTFQNEEVPPLSSSLCSIVRPVIRLPEKQVILTRINPEIRDTSVLVRFRPAWEDLRSYLTAKGRKRFEVYVCTMAERDYALEMWRLLDPEACLISAKQLLDRIICVKSGSRKSLLNVFQLGCCLPKMSMVIDDRLNVWDDNDQHRVHVVPAFAPYYAPQAETANPVPVLCVARNVACNVRGGFFKEFDENFLRRIFELYYENDIMDIPIPPDASDYLLSEDIGVAHNGNKDLPIFEGGGCIEIEKRSSQPTMSSGEQSGLQQVSLTRIPLPDDGVSLCQVSVNSHNRRTEEGSVTAVPSSLCSLVLQEIGKWCDSKVDFRCTINSNKDMQFCVEVLFDDDNVGVGMGRTRKEAQLHAAAAGLRYLASHYMAYIGHGNGDIESSSGSSALGKENGFLADDATPALKILPKEEKLHIAAMPDHSLSRDNPQRLSSLTLEIKDLLQHLGENINLVFREQPPTSMTLNKEEYYFQVEIPGQILGKGICYSKEGAMLQAAEDAVQKLKKQLNYSSPKFTYSSSLLQCVSPKRPKR